MYLIAGLGNPGLKYHFTRHNFGFIVLDKLAEFFNVTSFEECGSYLKAPVEHEGEIVFLLKPLTYMNSSGVAIRDFLDKNKIEFNNILIVYDDMYLNFGTLRFRPAGSDGGHNGMHSVIYELGTENIPRLRLGIRFETELTKFSPVITEQMNIYDDLAGYVLSPFSDEETKHLGSISSVAKDAVLTFINEGITAAMNKFNKSFLNIENHFNHLKD